ncbi:MAG: hypothetical protein QG597_3120, partial [Actinomycetota bacterium]|nr:hypothetical protein [Actinomycetota bacterium]
HIDDAPVIRSDTPVARFTLDDVLANPELFEDRQPAATIDLTETEPEAEPVMAQPAVAGGLTGLLGLTMAAAPSPRPWVAPEPVGQSVTAPELVLEVQAVSIPQARTAELTVPQMSTNRAASRRLRRKPSQPAPTLAKASGRTLGDLTGKGGDTA